MAANPDIHRQLASQLITVLQKIRTERPAIDAEQHVRGRGVGCWSATEVFAY